MSTVKDRTIFILIFLEHSFHVKRIYHLTIQLVMNIELFNFGQKEFIKIN